MIDLSVVIITWNMGNALRELLCSIREYTTGITYEIIVIDNFSTDDTVKMIEANFPETVLIKNSENRGVARARNQGLKIARGRYLQILDADMILKDNSLKKLVEFMDATPDAGICGCKLVAPDGTVQLSSRRYPTPIVFLLRRLEYIPTVKNSRLLKHHEMADWDRNDIRDVDYLIGACQTIRREAFEQVGFLDENIFYGPEDIDYCLRMYHNGWKVYYYPHTKIVHYEQRITRKRFFSKITLLHLVGIFYIFRKFKGRLKRIP
jgi:GT2 family glycosyltransferase